jgi:2-amino-4-hydroxy-6-hydroxymethyldihydropteridine diphosphokinase
MKRPRWRPAYVALGSNLGDPVTQVEAALDALRRIPASVMVAWSASYRSAPLCGANQPDYINAVAGLLTRLSSLELLQSLQRIEIAQGRERSGERWASRTLDLDLLAVAGETMDSDRLSLPHPGIAERNFVLLPWREIAPHFKVPGLATVSELADRVPDAPRIERLATFAA